jgi:hypothetical protein
MVASATKGVKPTRFRIPAGRGRTTILRLDAGIQALEEKVGGLRSVGSAGEDFLLTRQRLQ